MYRGFGEGLVAVLALPHYAAGPFAGGASVGLEIVSAYSEVPVFTLRPCGILLLGEEGAGANALTGLDGEIGPFPVFKPVYGQFSADRGLPLAVALT